MRPQVLYCLPHAPGLGVGRKVSALNLTTAWLPRHGDHLGVPSLYSEFAFIDLLPKSKCPQAPARALQASDTQKHRRTLILAAHSKTISEYEADKGSRPAPFQSPSHDQRRNQGFHLLAGGEEAACLFPWRSHFRASCAGGVPMCLVVLSPRGAGNWDSTLRAAPGEKARGSCVKAAGGSRGKWAGQEAWRNWELAGTGTAQAAWGQQLAGTSDKGLRGRWRWRSQCLSS